MIFDLNLVFIDFWRICSVSFRAWICFAHLVFGIWTLRWNFFFLRLWRSLRLLFFLFVDLSFSLLWCLFIIITELVDNFTKVLHRLLRNLFLFFLFLILLLRCMFFLFFSRLSPILLFRLNSLKRVVECISLLVLILEFLKDFRDQLDEDPCIHSSIVLLTKSQWPIFPIASLFTLTKLVAHNNLTNSS